jgi:hypothetical protein
MRARAEEETKGRTREAEARRPPDRTPWGISRVTRELRTTSSEYGATAHLYRRT